MSGKITKKLFTSSGTWTCPAGVTNVWLTGCGGGGAGAGGQGGGTNTSVYAAGGGGGSAAPVTVMHPHSVTPGTTYTITIGTGGTGGSGGTAGGATGNPGSNGSAGTNSEFDGAVIFYAGSGGEGGTNTYTSSRGGLPHDLFRQNTIDSGATWIPGLLDMGTEYGGGSGGIAGVAAEKGIGSSLNPGGTNGSYGTNAGTQFGGAAGGGGGSSEFGIGGAGGNGGNGAAGAAGVATAGANGTGYGGAGGGGGAGGSGGATPSSGRTGGDGADGFIFIQWIA